MRIVELDNQFVVPYNSALLKMITAQIKCNQSSAVVLGLFDKNNDESHEDKCDELR